MIFLLLWIMIQIFMGAASTFLYISEWTGSLPFVTAPVFMAGPISKGPKPL